MKKNIGVLAATLFLAAASTASAQFTSYTGNFGGFTPNSETAAYTLAVGGASQYHLDFDGFGFGPSILGNAFSPLVTFSSIASGTYGGVTSASINYSGSGSTSEIGPLGSWDGILSIDFGSNSVFASAVGFGSVDGDPGSIRLYDENGSLFQTDVALGNTFQFYGYVATGSQRISRVELEGGFHAIQDISFNVSPATSSTPEPATLALLAPGILGLAALRRRNRK